MQYLDRRVELIEERAVSVLDAVEPSPLAEQVRHVVLSGGKRVRPMVALLSCEAAGGSAQEALDFAVGIELVHSASLVVDDVIDDSDTRRGTDSAWAAFGYGPAIIASDGLLGEAFSLFLADERATEVVAQAMVDLGEGEAIELAAVPETGEEYLRLARRKTGALFRAAAQLGAVAADADDETIDAFGEYAERVGIAFQIRDDVLDATADADALGKPTGRDAAMDRPSLVRVTDISPEEANEQAHAHADDALDALSSVETTNDRAEEYLRDLAEFVVVREQ
ncbi:isopentenyl pyrophosphate isomerase [Halobacteriales archaeon QH_6_64_20]|jgi:geranylgeranyl diphosphate synthase type I|nr:MAG: isopentenyl pyrophosphate isomerase [Halobacteriales archaeon QH_6_64_20]